MTTLDLNQGVSCTVCNHDIGYHIGVYKSCMHHASETGISCSCIQFSDPRQPASKDYYYYADVPKGTDDPVKRPQGLVCPVCSHLFDNHRPTGMNWHIICDECPCWVDLMNLKQGDLRYVRA